MKWTEEQKAAIDTRKCELLVAAGAGSGKTAVLVQRIINKIIEDKVDIDKMLIVTFTNAAASEMRERIRDGLYNSIEEHPEISKQLLLINKASIMTIDAFCKKVIKDNFFKLNLDPNFKVADATENELLKIEALEEIIDELYEEGNENTIEIMTSYSDNKSDDGLKKVILSIYNFIQSSPFPEKWLKEKCEMYNVEEDDFAKTVWGKEIISYARSETKGILNEIQEMVDDLQNNNEAQNYALTLEDDLLMLKNILYNCNTWDDFYDYLSNIKISTLKNAPKLDEETKEEVKEIREKMKEIVKKYLKDQVFIMTSSEIMEDLKQLYKNLSILSDIVIKFEKRFKAKKMDKGLIDFNDMEHMCLELLNDNPDIALSYKEKYEEILIDEYQDSNLIQEFILNQISSGNIFMVGDVKQSIYRFRQARPELFLEKYKAYDDDLSSNSKEKKILLFKNFRSNINIIEQANFIFKNIMSKNVGEIDYTEDEYLKFGATYYQNEGTNAEIHLIEKSSKEEIEEDVEDDIEEKPQLEGRVIAKRISELVNNFEVYDKHTGKMRKARYSDIAILLRATKGYANSFIEELSKMNIPAFADVNTGYFENAEVQIIMSLLKIIDNPYQDIPLIAVMRSQIGNFSPDELTEIRVIDKNVSYYEALQKVAGQGNSKVRAFLNKIDEWRERSKHIKLDELIWSLYEETGYYNYVSLLPDGAIRTANLKTLLDKATMYEKTSYRGLFNFINFLDNIKESNGDLGTSKEIGENDNVVRIMSIHKSKGLEFPIVFLAGTSRKFNMKDFSNSIILHQDLGFGADIINSNKRIYYSSVPKLALKLKSKKESISEEMRILYVALTRAREKLIITALVNDVEKSLNKWSKKNTEYKVASSNNFAEWIYRTVISNNANWEIKEWTYNDILKLGSQESKDNYISTLLKNISIDIENTEEYKFIDSRLNFKYKYAYSTKIPNKVSVSELKRLSEYLKDDETDSKISELIEKPKFLNENKLEGTEYGTLVHNLMQRLDFKNPNVNEVLKSVDAEEKVKDSLKRELENFLKSNLYEEVKLAKRVYKEAPFNLEIRAEDVYNISDESKNDILMIQGIIDMYFENEEGIVLVDYKTDKVKSELELIKKYKKQLDYYEEALARLTNQKIIKKYIYSFALKKAIEI